MIEPVLSDEAFLADVEAADDGRDHLWWLGQSGFLLKSGGRRMLLDPYLSESLTRKYEKTDKPHVRMTRRVVDPGWLRGIDLITSTHNHTDHLDAETLLPVLANNPGARVVLSAANVAFAAERLGGAERLIGVDEAKPFEGAFTVHVVPACHEQVERDEKGHLKYVGFIVRTGRSTIYHSGDTLLYEGMIEALRPFGVDVALLPINGRAPERRVAGNLDGREAAELARAIGAKVVIPCHYDMFTFNTATPELFERTCRGIGQGYRVLRAGERFTWAF